LSDDDGSEAAEEDTAPQEEEEGLGEKGNEVEKIPTPEEVVASETCIIDLSVILGKNAMCNCPIKSTKLNFEHFELDTRQRASEGADGQKEC
jgi:hypothetical protein